MSDASADPMRVSALTIDYIFRRLLARYGSAFEQKWPEAAISDAKADWLAVLGPDERGRGGLTAGQVKHSLDNLPKDFPPNAAQFRDCALRASDKKPKITHEVKPDPKRLAAILASALPVMRARNPRSWIDDLQRRKDAGEQLSIAQLHCLTNSTHAPSADEIVDLADLDARKAEAQRRVRNYERSQAEPATYERRNRT